MAGVLAKRVNNERSRQQTPINSHQPPGAWPYMAYHTRGCHRQTDWRTQRNKGSRQENAYYINPSMIQHADADLTSNSRGPFQWRTRRSSPPPYLELGFFNAKNVVLVVGKPSGGYRKREKSRSSGRSNKARQVRWQMRNGSRFSWLRSGRESLHARTPIAPRAGDERVQLEKEENSNTHR